ncbi:MAG: conjugal transfer protein TraD [Sinobacteraceae bacterium]|nr:conjugal transfer protein TraD [Nevskiaceae bacterium]
MTERVKLTPEQRLARLQERTAKLKARISKASRRSDAHRKIMLGGLLIAAGVDQWNEAAVVGALLHSLAITRTNPDQMERWRQQGITHLQARETSRIKNRTGFV